MSLAYITWNPSPEIFSIGSFSIRWYGLLFAMGFFLSYIVLYHVFKKENIAGKLLDRLAIYVFLATVIGARLGHVFFYQWDYYRENLGEIFMVWKGGLASHGAGIAIIIALIIYIRQYKVNMWWLFDRAAMVIPIAAAFVRFGNLMNSEIYGITTAVPWGFVFVHDPDAGNVPRHPTQLYEAFSYLLISLVFYIIWRKNKAVVRPGMFVGIFLVAMFTARFLIEFLKTDQVPFEKGMVLDMGQLLSIPFILLGAFFLFWSYRKKKPAGENEKSPPVNEGDR